MLQKLSITSKFVELKKGEPMAEGKRFLNANDVAIAMECSKSAAYAIIRRLNEELKAKGFITIHGKINAKYFNERIYDGAKQ